ncbi:hypothetical protein [Novosphingobium sp.]|uniref:hypothetical protein n=1 Tax=Novosphingobium sp. TaxID=1874826 RepID=UPI0035ADBA33
MTMHWKESAQPGRKRATACLGLLLGGSAMLALAPQAAFAQSSEPPYDTITDLGTLGGYYSYPYDVSDDGRVVVGHSYVPSNSTYHAFRWTYADGMQDIGTLTADWSYATAVSGDGSTVVGHSYLSSGYYHAFRWTEAGGMQDLGSLSSGGSNDYSYAEAVNTDGSVVVGYSYVDSGSYHHAFRWTEAGGMQDLGTLSSGSNEYSYASDVSGSGDVVTGYSYTNSAGNYHAFRWTQAGGMQDIGTLGGTYSYAEAISRDGSTIIGHSHLASDTEAHAFRWTQAGGMQDLGTLGGTYSYARKVSNDGAVVVGYGYIAGNNDHHAFRWSVDGGMQDLGTLGGRYSYAYDVSGNGEVVVGYAYTPENEGSSYHHAFRWTEEDGMLDLGTLGGRWSYATAVSNDGGTTVGYSEVSDGNYHAFIYRTQMIDFTNMIASFWLTASDVEVAAEGQRDMLGQLVDSGCTVSIGRSACIGGAATFMRSNEDPAVPLQRRHDEGFRANVGVRLSRTFTAGFGAGVFQQQDRAFSVRPGTDFNYGAWLDWAPEGPSRRGLHGRLAVGGAIQRNVFLRGEGLENVQVTPGHTDLKTLTAKGTFGYGMDLGGMVFTPEFGFTWQRTTMDGFAEQDGDFPAVFNKTSYETSFVSAGAELAIPLAQDTYVTLGAKADFDVQTNPVVLTGTSQIPGMENFAVSSLYARKEVRGRFEAGISKDVGPGTVDFTAGVHTPTIGDKPVVVVGVGFGMDI